MNHFCQQASRLASDAYERRLNGWERMRLNFHCLMCRSCRHYRQALALLHHTLRQLPPVRGSLPTQVRQRIVQQCKEDS